MAYTADVVDVRVVPLATQYRVAVSEAWRTSGGGAQHDGLTQFKAAVSRLCGAPVDSVVSLNGATITSMQCISSGETVIAHVAGHTTGGRGLVDNIDALRQSLASVPSAQPGSSPQFPALALLDWACQFPAGPLMDWVNQVEATLARIPVAPNLIRNTFLRGEVIGQTPSGYAINTYKAGGELSCTAVHPFTQGFEGCYTETAPQNSVTPDNCDLAGEGKPVFFGTWNMGPRLSRGGLSTGWQGLTDGRMLRLAGTRLDQHEASVLLPAIDFGAASKVRVTGWVKVVQGAVSFSVDYLYWNNPGRLLTDPRRVGYVRAEDCLGQPQGWFHWDDIVPISNITKLSGGHASLLRCFGSSATGGLGPFEIYLALLHVSLVEDDAKVTVVPHISEW